MTKYHSDKRLKSLKHRLDNYANIWANGNSLVGGLYLPKDKWNELLKSHKAKKKIEIKKRKRHKQWTF